MRYTFTGAFAPHICGLIEKKQALGYDYFKPLINSAVSNFQMRPA